MNFGKAFLLAVIALVVVVAVYWLATHFFSAEAKLERRRRRSNSRIASNTKRPTVKFSVRTPKQNKD